VSGPERAAARSQIIGQLTSPRRFAPEDIPTILDKPEDENVNLLYHQTLREYDDKWETSVHSGQIDPASLGKLPEPGQLETFSAESSVLQQYRLGSDGNCAARNRDRGATQGLVLAVGRTDLVGTAGARSPRTGL